MTAPMRDRGLGWRPNPPGAYPRAHDLLARRAGRMGAAPLEKPSLLPFRSTPKFQGEAQTCVGFSLARALQLYFAANDMGPDVYPSPLDLYWKARREEHAGARPESIPPPRDVGCFPAFAMRAVRAQGFVLETDYPYSDDPERVNREPPPGLFLRGFDQRGLEYAVTLSNGAERVERVRQALRFRMPVIFGIQADAPFLENRGAVVTSIDPDQVVGGHMMAALEVLPNADVLVETWWPDHGLGDGLALLSGELFGSRFVSDVQIVEAAPLPVNA